MFQTLQGCHCQAAVHSGVLLGNGARDEVEKKGRGQSMNGLVYPFIFSWTECLCFPFLLRLPSNSYVESSPPVRLYMLGGGLFEGDWVIRVKPS